MIIQNFAKKLLDGKHITIKEFARVVTLNSDSDQVQFILEFKDYDDRNRAKNSATNFLSSKNNSLKVSGVLQNLLKIDEFRAMFEQIAVSDDSFVFQLELIKKQLEFINDNECNTRLTIVIEQLERIIEMKYVIYNQKSPSAMVAKRFGSSCRYK